MITAPPNVVIAPDDLWEWKQFDGFVQNIHGYTLYEDTPQEQWVEPTFDWYGPIKAKRRGSPDGEGYFYVQCRVTGKEGEPLNLALAQQVLITGLASLDTYAKCACKVGSPCERHKEITFEEPSPPEEV